MPRKRARRLKRATSPPAAEFVDASEGFDEYLRRENAREGLGLPRLNLERSPPRHSTERAVPLSPAFLDALSRAHAQVAAEPSPANRDLLSRLLARVADAAGHGLAEQTQAAMADARRYREQCRQSLRDGVSFECLDKMVESLPPTWRERRAEPGDQAAYCKAQDRADVWLALATGVAAERGRDFEWPEETAEALDGVAVAIRRLLEAFAQHPFRFDASRVLGMGLGALRSTLEAREFVPADALDAFALITPGDLSAAFARLRRAFRTTPRNRPRADWRHEAITRLRDTGVSKRDAAALADTAGLTTSAPPGKQHGRGARQKQRARARQRRARNSPRI